MAERRPPGFNVDLGFYDSAEVLSIPRRIRAAAIGVWTLCGAYSANKLSDGLVSAEALRDRGCTPAIRSALMSTTPEPLWVEAHDGGIQFTRWAKWQRTSEEIKTYREGEAERKREARAKRKQAAHDDQVSDTYGSRGDHVATTWSSDEAHVPPDMSDTYEPDDRVDDSPTSGDGETSGRTSAGQSSLVPPDDRDPKTETETETVSGQVSRPPRKRGTRLAANWMPSQESIDAVKTECPNVNLEAEHRKFVDYWTDKTGKDATKQSWDGTWRNWIRRAAESGHVRASLKVVNGTGSAVDDKVNGWLGLDLTNGYSGRELNE